MDELTREFLLESYENLDRLDQEFVKLETEPGNLELLKSIFRTIHTIKGTCGFLGFSKLETLAHAGENLLSMLRDGHLALNSEITTALLAMVDAVREMLASIDTVGNEGERDDHALIETLARLLNPPVAIKEEAPPAKTEEAAKNPEVQPEANIGEILIKRGAAKVIDVYDAVHQQEQGDPRRVGEILVEKGAVKSQELVEALNLQQQARAGSTSDSTIRVEVSQLDRLMNRVGELVLLRNQILQFSNNSEDSGLLATSQRLNLITTELQEGVMKTRMQPIGNIWSKFPRTVRDVAMSCGKKVRIEMEGKETELDKTIIEAIKDPLTHIVRNSVDHGIETPEKRIAAGKPVEGLLSLRAYHEGGQVNIEISDDGAGLDLEKIRKKAVEKGVITAEQSARMTEREAANLIFLPGLSTAEKVTNVSGRGVGMDVVRTNIDKIGGSVDVQSKPGAGSTVRMKIPLTLAIIPALIVTNRGDRYAIPQISLLELVRLEGRRSEEADRVGTGRAGVSPARTLAAAGVSGPRATSRGAGRRGAKVGGREHRSFAGGRTAIRAGGGRDYRHGRNRSEAARQAVKGRQDLRGLDDHGRRTGGSDSGCAGTGAVGERGGREPGTHARERIRGNGSRSAKTNDAAVAVRSTGTHGYGAVAGGAFGGV